MDVPLWQVWRISFWWWLEQGLIIACGTLFQIQVNKLPNQDTPEGMCPGEMNDCHSPGAAVARGNGRVGFFLFLCVCVCEWGGEGGGVVRDAGRRAWAYERGCCQGCGEGQGTLAARLAAAKLH